MHIIFLTYAAGIAQMFSNPIKHFNSSMFFILPAFDFIHLSVKKQRMKGSLQVL